MAIRRSKLPTIHEDKHYSNPVEVKPSLSPAEVQHPIVSLKANPALFFQNNAMAPDLKDMPLAYQQQVRKLQRDQVKKQIEENRKLIDANRKRLGF